MADRESTGRSRTTKADTKRTRPWLRRVGVVVGCLLAGAIINVLVAWGCAIRVEAKINQFSQGPMANDALDWAAKYGVDLGRGITDSNTLVVVNGIDTPGHAQLSIHALDGRNHRVVVDVQLIQDRLPYWSRVELGAYATQHEAASGWPLKTMYYGMQWNSPDTSDVIVDGVLHLGGDKWLVPTSPITLGFVANTHMYAGVLIAPFFLRRIIRRHQRKRRGMCPDCGYDLRGADHGKCPECGEVVGEQTPTAEQPDSQTG